MKTTFLPVVFLWSFMALALIGCPKGHCAETQKSVATLAKEVIESDELWKAGRTREYYAQVDEMAKDIAKTSTEVDLSEIAARLLGNLVTKDVHDVNVGSRDLYAMRRLVLYLFSRNHTSTTNNPDVARLLSLCLGKIRKEIIPNYKWAPACPNVVPPLSGGQPVFAGMDPAAISDPVARAAYEKAIRKNNENGVTNSRQSTLKQIEPRMAQYTMNYLIDTFHATDLSSPILAECISLAQFSEKEKNDVLSKIGAR